MSVTNHPLVTIILPIRNECLSIKCGLDSILAQDYPPDQIEVLVADGMSGDGTRQIVQEFREQHPELDLRLLDNPGKIVPTGLNIGLRQAQGEVIVRVDGHTVIAPDYVRQCVETLQRTHADNTGGRMNAQGGTFFGEAVALATSTPFGIGGGRFHYSDQEEWVDTVYMGAWPRVVFEKIGLFDEELVRDQDDEFNYRLRAADGRIFINPQIRSEYTVRSTPVALWRQYYQYGYWKVRVLQKHPRQMRPRQFVPPAFVLVLLASFLLSFLSLWGLALFLLTALLYISANLFASVLTASQKGWKYVFLLPLVFAILHVGYGSGFLVGLIRFADRWKDRRGRAPAWSDETLPA